MENVVVKEVKTKREMKTFCDFPNKLYKDNPNYVPSFLSDDLDDWNEDKNPAFDYCEGKCFLAYRGKTVVGRIGAILSHKANEKWKTERMRFSQVDFIDDREVSAALFEAVEAWAKEKGCNQVHGPLGFTDSDREGMLVEGFDRKSMFITYYNSPYYIEHLEALGYCKDVDWIEYRLDVSSRDSDKVKVIEKMNQRIERQGVFHVVKLNRRSDYKPYIKKIFGLVNEAYSHLYGMVELTDKQIERYAKKFIPLINPDYVCLIVNNDDDLVAFGVTVPSLSDAMIKCRGRLFPFGFIRILKALKKNDTVDMLLVAVKPELQSTSLMAMIFNHFFKSTAKNGILYAETGPMLETNTKIHAQWKFFEKEQHKRRRCFIKDI